MEEQNTRRRIPVSGTTAEERLLEYVEEQTAKFAEYTKLNNTGNGPGYYELTEALCNYSEIQSSLITADVLAKIDLQKKQDAFDDWYADAYTAIRNRENPRDISAQKWIGSREIEMLVRSENRQEFNRLNQDLKCAEMKVAYLRRLLDAWDNYKFNLARLCKNEDAQISSVRMMPDMTASEMY